MAPRRPRSTSIVSSNPNISRAPTSSPLLRKQIVVASDSIYQNNLTVLKRGDPTIVSIIDQFSHVCLYNYNGRTGKWAKEGFEGSMFIVEHADEPVYGIYILNRMGTGDYVRRIYPEDDMEVFEKYLMYRYYPEFTEKRLSMNLPYPVPDEYRLAFETQFATDNSQPDDPDPHKKRKMQGNSITLGYWAFQQEAREPLEDVMMRLREYIKAGLPYPDEFRYFPGRQARMSQPVFQRQNGDHHSPSTLNGVGTHEGIFDMSTSQPSEVDKLFAKLQPTHTPVPALIPGLQPSASQSVQSWFAALAGQGMHSPHANDLLNTIPRPSTSSSSAMGSAIGPAASSRGLALLDSIFASVSQSSASGSLHDIMQPTQQHFPPHPEEIQIVSPKPQSSTLPQILNQNVISSLLGLSPGSGDSRSSSAALSSSSSRRSGAKRYEGDNELSESEAASEGGYSASSTVLEAITNPVVLPRGSPRDVPSFAFLSQDAGGLLAASTSVQGDVTPRAGLRGFGPASPSLLPQSGQPYLAAPTANAANGSSVLTAHRPTSASPAGRARSLVPFSTDHELWPYPRPPLNDNEQLSDADIVELDFSDTRALSNPSMFEEKQAKQVKGDRKRKGKKEKAADRERERAAIVNGWDDPTKGQVTLRTSSTISSVSSCHAESVSASSVATLATLNGKGKRASNGNPPVAIATSGPAPINGTNGAVKCDADIAREALLASLAGHPNGPRRNLSRKQFVQKVLSLIHTDNSFVDRLYQEYSSCGQALYLYPSTLHLTSLLYTSTLITMGWFGDDSDQSQAYQTYADTPPEDHRAKVSHELIAGAAAFEAAKAYEDHVQREGQPESHARAKELLAGFAGAFVDREVETKGLDFIDKERAKRQAEEQLHSTYDQTGGQW
ncbi:hypothetical protein BC835DRAFT_1412196 [Cytidiella melzeri]|nr:hypothetical protein BC835DRAFT_1412196 [Cytidiella melzeri]